MGNLHGPAFLAMGLGGAGAEGKIASMLRAGYFCPMVPKNSKSMPLVIFLLGAAFLLAGCTPGELAGGDIPLSRKETSEILEKAGWKLAEKVDIDIRQHEFRPSIIRLLRGEPYILILENRDDVEHLFLAREFFKTAAILKLIRNEEPVPGPVTPVIELQPGDLAELHFIPARDGWFPFEDGSPGLHHELISIAPLSRGKTRCMVGSFIVQE